MIRSQNNTRGNARSVVAFLAALVLAQPAPDVAVVVSRSAGVTPARIAKLLTRLEQRLSEGEVKSLSRKELATRLGRLGQKDATFCAGKPSFSYPR